MTSAEEPARAVDAPAAPGSDSDRVAAARLHAGRRLHRQRGTLRPLGLGIAALVVASTLSNHPAPAQHGEGIAVTVALCTFIAALAVVLREHFPERTYIEQTASIALLGAAGVTLGAVQPRGATELAAGVAVFMALARLPLGPGVALGACVTAALAIATALAGSSASAVLAGTLLCVVLGLVAGFMRQARESQDRTELLLAQLEDAQEAQAHAVAVAERGRIAGELHDVLAHSLSGAAIQLEGARMLAERDSTTPQMRAAIERASALVKEGLANARQAVGALRGDELPNVAGLEALIQGFKTNLNVDATFKIEGIARTLPADASLALYRGAQEALTNVARYAPLASTSVVLRYDRDRTILSVENRQPVPADASRNPIPADASRNLIPATANRTPSPPVASGGLVGVGGGRGLAGMRERVERSGGSVHAGPTDDGWRVELQVPV